MTSIGLLLVYTTLQAIDAIAKPIACELSSLLFEMWFMALVLDGYKVWMGVLRSI
jgi:hypothetical protein